MKRYRMKAVSGFMLMCCPLIALACNKNEPENPQNPYIEPAVSSVQLSKLSCGQVIDVDTNVKEIDCSVSPGEAGWLTATYAGNKLHIAADNNNSTVMRTAAVTLSGQKITRQVTVSQEGRSTDFGSIPDNIKIPVKSASAPSIYGANWTIEKSFDGDPATHYHSSGNNTVPGYFPITMTYNFENAETIDYIVYKPRASGVNGLFEKFDLMVATEDNPVPTLYNSYDFKGNTAASTISLTPALTKPTQIQFVVRSGTNDFVSCAEMEFYKKASGGFDPLSVFSDQTCSGLKPAVTKSDIDKIESRFFRDMALEMYEGQYDSEFRIQEYKAWQHPGIMAKINKTSTYSLRDNPTGLYAVKGEEIILFAGETHNQSLSLFIQDPDKQISGSGYPLVSGTNRIIAANDGLMYILYHTETGTEPPVKIHIATGSVNGYFDSGKHQAADWNRLLNKAAFRHFDLLGRYAHLTFETAKFREFTPDGLILIDLYDDMVYKEQEFMGLFKYGREFKNRMYFLVMANSSYMHAAAYYTGYDLSTQKDLLTFSSIKTSPWGPAHEVGHVNQTRPGLRWAGTTEVTNNIHSLHIQTSWGNQSRLITDNHYAQATAQIIDKKIAHNTPGNNVFHKLVPFWQLKLYMQDVSGKTDFYKDLYEAVRINPDPPTDGHAQMEFVKLACDISGLDLTEFFEAWGFLTPIDVTLSDYGDKPFLVTEAMIAQCRAYIADKNYPKPLHTVQNITDHNIGSFK